MNGDKLELDLVCNCGHEYTVYFLDTSDSVEAICPSCNTKEIVTKADIESALDEAEQKIIDELGL